MSKRVPFFSVGGMVGDYTLTRAAYNGAPSVQIGRFAESDDALSVARALNSSEHLERVAEAARDALTCTDANADPSDALEAIRAALEALDAQQADALSRRTKEILAALEAESAPGDLATIGGSGFIRKESGWRPTLVKEGEAS